MPTKPPVAGAAVRSPSRQIASTFEAERVLLDIPVDLGTDERPPFMRVLNTQLQRLECSFSIPQLFPFGLGSRDIGSTARDGSPSDAYP